MKAKAEPSALRAKKNRSFKAKSSLKVSLAQHRTVSGCFRRYFCHLSHSQHSVTFLCSDLTECIFSLMGRLKLPVPATASAAAQNPWMAEDLERNTASALLTKVKTDSWEKALDIL